VIRPLGNGVRTSFPSGYSIDKGRVRFGGFPLQIAICMAFNLKPYQVSGPAWITTAPFDIEAKLSDGSSENQVPFMLQALLADRFKMVVRRERREQPVYAIVIDKGGLKIQQSTPTSEPAPAAPAAIAFGSPTGQFSISDGQMTITFGGGGLKISEGKDDGAHFHLTQMSSLADFLSTAAGRPVIDRTGLKAGYQFDFDVSDEEMSGGAGALTASRAGGPGVASDPGNGPVFFQDVLKKIGLNLESQKASIEMLVIEHIEQKPTDN
jgi:uncharacterized protein (TIGR03435 family)